MTDDRPVFLPAQRKPAPREATCGFCHRFGPVTARTLCRKCTRDPAIRARFPTPREANRTQRLFGERTLTLLVEEQVKQIAHPHLKLVARTLLRDRIGRLLQQVAQSMTPNQSPGPGASAVGQTS
jgi:hypothetical protein